MASTTLWLQVAGYLKVPRYDWWASGGPWIHGRLGVTPAGAWKRPKDEACGPPWPAVALCEVLEMRCAGALADRLGRRANVTISGWGAAAVRLPATASRY